jgi:hypothetical protein
MPDSSVPKDTRITPPAASVQITGQKPTVAIGFGAEHWQFFAFAFAALVTIGFVLLDEIPGPWPRFFPRWGAKILVFIGLGYLTLYNWTVKDLLVRMLPTIKTKVYR